MPATPIHRAPMRARNLEAPEFAGARHGVEHELVGTGDALPAAPATIEEAVALTEAEHGEKAGRMLSRFADLPERSFVWTRTGEREYRLGRITGPWRYDDSAAARKVGIHHVRPARWLGKVFEDQEVPAAVTATFARGGRNFQRTHDERAETATARLWDEYANP